jgi:hypothetical protein
MLCVVLPSSPICHRMSSVFLAAGDEVELVPRGYLIRCISRLDEYPDLTIPVDFGVFTEDMVESMLDILSQLTDSVGKMNRSETYAIAKRYGAKWPVNTNGVPAWLEGYTILGSNGEGNKYIMKAEETPNGKSTQED